jgi:hypothetical protein
MGVPVAVGCTVGDAPAGLLATLGAFTSLYGTDRPYLNRSILLALPQCATAPNPNYFRFAGVHIGRDTGYFRFHYPLPDVNDTSINVYNVAFES